MKQPKIEIPEAEKRAVRAAYMRAYRRRRKEKAGADAAPNVVRVTVNLPEKLFRSLQRKAHKAGEKKFSTFCRKALEAMSKDRLLVPQDLEDRVGEAIFLLRNIANNVNQVAKRANTKKELTILAAQQARAELQTLEKVFLKIRDHDN